MTNRRFLFASLIAAASVFSLSGPAQAQCAGGYTNSIGDRICGTAGSGAPAATPSIEGAIRSPIAGGGPVYVPNIPPPDCSGVQSYDENGNVTYTPLNGVVDCNNPVQYNEADVTAKMDEIQAAMGNYTDQELEAAANILEQDEDNPDGMSFDDIMSYDGPIDESYTANYVGTVDYSYNQTMFMGQNITEWNEGEVTAVLNSASMIMDTHFTAEEIAAAQEILDATPLDQLMEGGPPAVNNELSYDIGLTAGGDPLTMTYDENSFMDQVVSDYTEAEVDAMMTSIETVFSAYSEAEIIAATDNVLAGTTIAEIMEYSNPLNTFTSTPFTIATNSLGTPIVYNFLQNSFMGTLVTPYAPADVQPQMDAISAAIADFTDAELTSVESILAGTPIDDILTYPGPLVETATTTYDLATDSLGTLIQFDFNSQTFMGVAVTGYDPSDVDDTMAEISTAIADLSDADLATVQAQLDGMNIDDIMTYADPVVVSSAGGAAYSVGTDAFGNPITFTEGIASFMGTPLTGSAYDAVDVQAKADDIAAAITAAGGAAAQGADQFQAVLNSMTPDEVMNYSDPYYTVQVEGGMTVYRFMGTVVFSEPVV